ncbi:MAG: carbohydrate-binding protein [Flavobacterium sp.]|nr:carbohydrate-binding protein [Flavobacterium sp.]
MSGGAGVEYYFGYQRPDSDLSLQNFRSRDQSWNYCKIALDFFNQYVPFWEMSNADNITTGTNSYTLAKTGQVYVVYLRNGGGASVNLPSGNYTVKWYNPRSGGALQNGNVTSVSGGGTKSIGNAPDSNDWVALIRNTNFTHTGNPSTGNNTIAVTSVSVSPTSATLNGAGTTRTLQATINPTNATNQNVTWTSSNTAVATVNSNGSVTAVANGTATITVTTQDGNKTATSQITVSIPTVGQSAYPSGTPHPIPGTVESENYDTGGQGVAYNDTDSANRGNEYRTTEAVDVQTCSEGGFNVGWIQNGEWLEYTVNVARAGNYKIDIRYAALSSTGNIHVDFNGANVSQGISLAPTGAWQTYTTVSKTVTLNAGTQVMRVTIDAGGINLNKVTFTEIVPVSQTYTLSPIQDAYLEGGTRFNSEDLRVESGRRVSYLQFDLSGISGTITEASLKLGVSSDPGNGTIIVNKGNTNNWTENNITTSNAPSSGVLLGSLNTTYNSGQSYIWTLTPASISSGAILSLVIIHTAGNDVSFASDENTTTALRPILTIKASSNSAKAVQSLFDMYPNPALNDNTITVALKDGKEGTVTVTNMSGKVILEASSLNNEFKIDTSKLREKGIYFITIQSENKIDTQKLIVN